MKKDTVAKVIAALKKLRIKKDISQEALSKMSGVDRSYISRLEKGEVNPSFRQIERLANTLGAEIKLVIT